MKRTLPAGITAQDLKYPDFHDKDRLANVPYEDKHFEMWRTELLGWCIPTLGIRGAGRSGRAPRTYAVSVTTGNVCRIGLGPHVLERVTVYVRQSRVKGLQKFIDMKNKGAVDANNIRDRISSRRAMGAMYRMSRGW